MNLLAHLQSFFLQYGTNQTYNIAYSGGLDSHVLLALCASLRASIPLQLRAIHVHHGLSRHADDWALHCAKVTQALHIDYIEHRIHFAERKKNIEAQARKGRYAIFKEHLLANDFLLTAHHQDDQAETLLLQLLRGAGPKGLAAMPLMKSFGQGWHARPVLNVARKYLHEFARQNKLQWIEDESNQNVALSRNYIRHEILPLLKKRWPNVSQTLARSAKHCAEMQNLVAMVTQEREHDVQGSDVDRLSIKKLLTHSPAEQRFILRAWILRLNYPLPDTKKLAAIENSVLRAAADRNPLVRWQQIALRRYRDDLYLLPDVMRSTANYAALSLIWDFRATLHLPVGQLSAQVASGVEGLRLDIQQVLVKYRQGGERCQLNGQHKSLKNLFQAWAIPPWLRQHIPLLFYQDQLIAVVGYYVDERVKTLKDQPGWIIKWHAALTK